MLTVPPKTNSGATLRIKGRGFTGKTGERGDQLVTLMIHLPTDLSGLEEFVANWDDARNPREVLNV